MSHYIITHGGKSMKIFFNLLTVSLLAVMLTFGVAGAKTFPNIEGKVEISIPDDWKSELKNNVLQVESPEDGITLFFDILKDDKIEDALANTEKNITSELGELVTERTAEVMLNGMNTMIEDYKTKDGLVKVSVMLVLTPAGKYMLCYYLGTEEADKKYEKELTEIVGSIKPLDEKRLEDKKEEKKDR